MAELDVEKLKRRVTRYHHRAAMHSYEWYAVAATDLNAILAALEDRDRLRAALVLIRDFSNRMLEGDEQNHDLRDIARWAHHALKGRDD